MRKSSRAISLALIGSALSLAGCTGRGPETEGGTAPDTRQAGSGSHGVYHHGGWWYWGRPGSSGSPSPSPGGQGAGVSRGGFGGAGHAAGGS
jgi:hypothetical protein